MTPSIRGSCLHITILRQILLVVFAALLLVSSAAADVVVPHITTRVYDETSTLTPDQINALSTKLAFYEDSTSTQIVVVIVKSLDGAEINDYATTLGNQNAVGQSKKHNGIVLLIAMKEHQTYIATGYGMEPTVTDAMASALLRDVLQPALRNGDFYGGINSTVDSIVSAAKGEFKGSGTSSGRNKSPKSGMGLLFVLIIFVIIAVIRAAVGTGLRKTVVGAQGAKHGFMGGFLSALFWSNIFRGGGGGGGGFGGGSGGGGFGGFSGGGGSFGGGGAGGSW